MSNESKRELEQIIFPHGVEIDLDEGWKKLISRQFGGDPGRGFAELIQNLLDSYPEDVPWAERSGLITSGERWIAIADQGEGMGLERLRLLLTLGGTDKSGAEGKIGRFGIGFFSIFNPALGTRKVTVNTRCEGEVAEVIFKVREAGRPPSITTRLVDGKEESSFSTRVKVEFKQPGAVERCLQSAKQRLRYYPCSVTINGAAVQTAWDDARSAGLEVWHQDGCTGVISPRGLRPSVTLLSRYEHVLHMSLSGLLTGGHDQKSDLRDYRQREMPYLPSADITLNCDNLSLTIGRNSFYLDGSYRRMLDTLAEKVGVELLTLLCRQQEEEKLSTPLVAANQFILAGPLRSHIRKDKSVDGLGLLQPYTEQARYQAADGHALPQLLEVLADAPVYGIVGRLKPASLRELMVTRTEGTPIFFCSTAHNLRWLGGSFEHDFIVVPPACSLGGGAPTMFDNLLETVLGDVVNLDTVMENQELIAELVKREIVKKEDLEPEVSLVDEVKVEPPLKDFLERVNALLQREAVLDAVRDNLMLPVQSIEAVYFEVQEGGITVPAALMDLAGEVLKERPTEPEPLDLLLGLGSNHPLVMNLARSKHPQSAHFALTYLAQELAKSQRILVPYSRFYNLVRDALTRDLRRGLIQGMLGGGAEVMA